MIFEQALKAMREGKKVARKHWAIVLESPVHICILDKEILHYTGIDYYDFPLDSEDVMAEDWEVVDE